jgi:hypothetical protein
MKTSKSTDLEKPLFVEVGFSRMVVTDGFKLILNLLPPVAAADGDCRSIHAIKVPSLAERSAITESLATAKAGKIKLMYDAADRHPEHHCDRVQLYELASDPSEQHNLADQQPERVSAMRELIMQHVAVVEGSSHRAKHIVNISR